MRLAHVIATPFKFKCLRCGNWKTNNQNTLADLDGEAFKAYYCGECTAEGAPRTGRKEVENPFAGANRHPKNRHRGF